MLGVVKLASSPETLVFRHRRRRISRVPSRFLNSCPPGQIPGAGSVLIYLSDSQGSFFFFQFVFLKPELPRLVPENDDWIRAGSRGNFLGPVDLQVVFFPFFPSVNQAITSHSSCTLHKQYPWFLAYRDLTGEARWNQFLKPFSCHFFLYFQLFTLILTFFPNTEWIICISED